MSLEASLESPEGRPLDAWRDIEEFPQREPSTGPDELPGDLPIIEETEEDRVLKAKVREWVMQTFNYQEKLKADVTTDPRDQVLRKKVLMWTQNIRLSGRPTISLRNHAAEPTIEDPDVYVQEEKIQQWIRKALQPR